eukprot:6205774-Pyramimonas_sp.AAC.1
MSFPRRDLEEPLLGTPTLQHGERKVANKGSYGGASMLSCLLFAWAGDLLRVGYNLHYGEPAYMPPIVCCRDARR